MNIYPRVYNEKAWLVQAITTQNVTSDEVCFKACFMGVKESVKAVCANALGNGRDRLAITFVDRGSFRLLQEPARFTIKQLTGSPYVIGCIYHQDILKNVIATQNTHDIHTQAYSIFKRHLNFPIIPEWMPILWKIATTHGFAMPLNAVGTDDLSCFHVTLPSSEIFMSFVEAQLNELYHAAKAVA